MSVQGDPVGEANQQLLYGIKRGDIRIFKRALEKGADLDAEDSDGNTPLLLACRTRRTGMFSMARQLLVNGANLQHRNRLGDTAFDFACGRGCPKTIAFFIHHGGFDINAAGWHGLSQLHRILTPDYDFYRSDKYAACMAVLDNGADVNAADPHGVTPLMKACSCGSRQLIQLLLDRGSLLMDRDAWGKTALHVAASREDDPPIEDVEEEDPRQAVEVVRELIERGADMSVRNNRDQTPFDLVANQDDADATEICNVLLTAYKVQLVARDGLLVLHAILREAIYLQMPRGRSFHAPLHPLGVRLPFGTLGFSQFWVWLRSFDANLIQSRDNNDNGALPIHVASGNGAPSEVLRILVDLDPASLHIPDHTGALAVHVVCGSGRANLESLRLLVEQGGVGTLSARDHMGALPLHRLLGTRDSRPDLDAVKFLVQAFRGSLSIPNSSGELPFAVACKTSCSVDVMHVLLTAYPDALSLSRRRR